jgi:hypothetical protein
VKRGEGEKISDDKLVLMPGRHVLKLGRKWAAVVVPGLVVPG